MSQNKEEMKKNQIKRKKSKNEKTARKGKINEKKEKIGAAKKIGKANVNFRLPENLRIKIDAEKNPNEVISTALSEYYSGLKRREELAVQREIDNNIIEVQRRHISDLKDQLAAANRNYEELIRIHQAYMLQVQPLIESAKENEKSVELTIPDEKMPEPQAVPKKKWYQFWK
ncbi:hypothetical protein [Methanolapillus millepedarum]|uniref:Uncharacterized protein n=1 Tax=Methanolapillus millepedarum TaxID=3028296 RepID=A0AA96VC65_9EURY|nr:hypothetical protein MsAc7_10680 [Methanosarcinaceae archaeon Ac7]